MPKFKTSPSALAVKHEDVLRVADALAELPDGHREAIVLRYWENRPLAEIAERLGKSTAAVAGLLQRGLKELKALLRDKPDSHMM